MAPGRNYPGGDKVTRHLTIDPMAVLPAPKARKRYTDSDFVADRQVAIIKANSAYDTTRWDLQPRACIYIRRLKRRATDPQQIKVPRLEFWLYGRLPPGWVEL
jgi:hypothetical protein